MAGLVLAVLVGSGCGGQGGTVSEKAGAGTAPPAGQAAATAHITVVPQWLGANELRVYGTASVTELSVTLQARGETLATAKAQVQNGNYEVRLGLPAGSSFVELELVVTDPKTNQVLRRQGITREF